MKIEAYDERFCNQPISYKEFLNIMEGRLRSVYIFTPKDNGFYLIVFEGFGIVEIFNFQTINDTLSITNNEVKIDDFDVIKYVNKNSYYDMITSYRIFQQ